MAAWTWRKWPDPLVDFRRELYVPWQIAQGGKVLYRDIAHFSGPLSAYFNALLFRVFGPGMMVLAWANLALLAILAASLYSLLRQSSNRLAATAACTFMLPVFAFGQMTFIGNYNFVTPYAHELTHGLVLSVVGLWALRRGLLAARTAWLAAGAAALGLAFLTKPEVSLAAAAGMGTLLLTAPSNLSRKKKWGAFALSTLVPPLLATALLSSAMPTGQATRRVLGGWNWVFNAQLQELPFYQSSMGLTRLGSNFALMLAWAACYGGALAAAITIASVVRTRRPIAGLLAFAVTTAALMPVWSWVPWDDALRGLPLALTVAGAIAAAILWRTPDSGARASGRYA